MKRDIFTKRINIKPLEYPNLLKFKEAINHSYWLHTEFNLTGDIQDYKINLNSTEKSLIKNSMLAVSQIEVAPKKYWGNISEIFPKPEIDDIGGTFSECHGEGTEILTPKGWVNLKNIKKGDSVLQYTKNETFEVTKVNEVIKKHHDGDIINFSKRGLSTRVTPNHRIIYYTKGGELKERFAKDINLHCALKVPNSAKLTNEKSLKLTNFDRLKIAIQADGCARFYKKNGVRIRRGLSSNTNTYEISVKKERKKKRLLQLLEATQIPYRQFKVKRQGFVKYEIDMPTGVDYKTFDWVCLEDKDWKWCEEFIQELVEWDGMRLPNKKDCKIKYSTTVKSCADIAQMVGIGAGYKCNMGIYIDKRKKSYKDVYIVSFLTNRKRVGTNTRKEIIDYTGNVYCVNVDSGMIITRYELNTFISGNSEIRHKDAYAVLLEKLGLNSEFKKIHSIPAIIDRVNYLNAFKINTNHFKRDAVLGLVLFSLFVEHISLFGQFFIIMSFNKHKNLFKGMSNIVEATSKEEEIHGRFGIELYKIIKRENKELFDDHFYESLQKLALKALKAESKIIDWIYEKGDVDFVPKNVVKNYVNDRFNKSLKILGIKNIVKIDEDLLKQSEWFDIEILSTKENDFFNKRGTDYSKNKINISIDAMFK